VCAAYGFLARAQRDVSTMAEIAIPQVIAVMASETWSSWVISPGVPALTAMMPYPLPSSTPNNTAE